MIFFILRTKISSTETRSKKKSETNTAQNTTFVSQSAPQAHPVFLLKPVRYLAPNHPRATVIRPILSSNINLPVRFSFPHISFIHLLVQIIRPPLMRPVPPRLIRTHAPPFNPIEPVSVQRQTSSRETTSESLLSSLSPLSSIHEEIPRKRKFCSCLPCCRSQEEHSMRSSSSINARPISNNPNLPCRSRTIYILTTLLFIFFVIVIILLIVLIVVRR